MSMRRNVALAFAGMILSGSALAQTQPPAGETPAPEEKSVQSSSPPSPADRNKQGNEVGWGGQQKTGEEQQADPKRNEAQGQPPG
jgi:hypothetical protein